MVLGLAARNGWPISFREFTRYGAVIAAITIAFAAPYLWLRYFVLARAPALARSTGNAR